MSAPRVTVRARLPWPLRGLLLFSMFAIAAAAGVAIYDYGHDLGGPDRRELTTEVERLRSQLREATLDRDRHAALSTAWESQLKVEHATQEQLVAQVRSLESESNKLKEDLTFFESLLPAGTGNGGIVIRSFRVQPEGEPNIMRYRLLVQQSGKPEHDFVGVVQLQVSCLQGTRAFVLELPGAEAAAQKRPLALSFRHYQRLEGTFELPAGAVVKAVHVKVLADGQIQTQQSFTM